MTPIKTAAAALFLALAAVPGQAGAQTLPPAQIPGGADPAAADPSSLVLRLQALEAAVRDLRGRVERLQYENRRLTAALGAAGGAVTVAPAPMPAPAPSIAAGQPPLPVNTDGADGAFDPAKRPLAPGAPKPLGTPGTASAPLVAQEMPTGPIALPGAAPLARSQPQVAAVTPAPQAPPSNADAYGVALAAFRQGDTAAAERGFSAFIAGNPRDRRVAEATYLLGASYDRERRPRDAARQYLKVAKDFPASARAPDAMLHLGIALHALGNDPQACATLDEVGRRYPQAAAANARARAARERKSYRCGG